MLLSVYASFSSLDDLLPYAFHSSSLTDELRYSGYSTLVNEIDELAKQQEGYLGIDSSNRDTNGLGITISYWKSGILNVHLCVANCRYQEVEWVGRDAGAI